MSATSTGTERRAGESGWRGTVATVAVIIATLILLGLGTWQVQRLGWKNDLIARIDARIHADPVPLPVRIDDPDGWEYRPVTVTGTFVHQGELPIAGRVWRGQPGWHIVTPLLRADGGGTVLVNRGFVPHGRQEVGTRPESLTEGVVTVTGLARVPGRVSWLQPDNRPAERTWFWYDLPAMASAAGVDRVAPVIVEAVSGADPAALPIGGQTVVSIRNDHLSYAITWYGLAAALLAMWGASRWKARRSPKDIPDDRS